MYVCICHGLRESDVLTARTSGAATAAGVFATLGLAPQCGRCVTHMHGMVCQADCRTLETGGNDNLQSKLA